MSTSHSANTDLTSLGSPAHSPLVPKRWDFSKLRPTPPLRPAYALAAKEVSIICVMTLISPEVISGLDRIIDLFL